MCNNMYPDTGNSILPNAATTTYANASSNYSQVAFNPKKPYNVNVVDQCNTSYYVNGNQINIPFPNTAYYNGYNSLFAPALCKGAF